jgi:hypothetical protein
MFIISDAIKTTSTASMFRGCGFLIHLDKARRVTVSFIEDANALLKLKIGGGVNLPQFTLSRTQTAQENHLRLLLE